MKSAVETAVADHRPRAATRRHAPGQQLRWAAARITFYAYIGFSMATLGLGGFVTAPVMTWYFYGDVRFWRHWHSAKGLFPHAYKMLRYVLQGRNGGFMLGVPLTAPPHTSVDPERVELHPTWEFGSSCGPCSRCCTKIACPVLDRDTGLCRGYDTFFWRYFNCGRFPTQQREIDYYLCNKWQLNERPSRAWRRWIGRRREAKVA